MLQDQGELSGEGCRAKGGFSGRSSDVAARSAVVVASMAASGLRASGERPATAGERVESSPVVPPAATVR